MEVSVVLKFHVTGDSPGGGVLIKANCWVLRSFHFKESGLRRCISDSLLKDASGACSGAIFKNYGLFSIKVTFLTFLLYGGRNRCEAIHCTAKC